LFIDQKWGTSLIEGNWLIFDVYTALDPTDSPKLWNERLFKQYAVALVKKQWGANLSKYVNIALPGGVTIDGQRIYDEGKSEVEDIEDKVMNQLAPLEFQMG
jgi:hypothetical protein